MRHATSLFRLVIALGFACLHPPAAFAYDCSQAGEFSPGGTMRVFVDVSRMELVNGTWSATELCHEMRTVRWFDIRGREEEAYYCLLPTTEEFVACPTEIAGQAARIEVFPASMIRTWHPEPARDYHFHAYVVREGAQDFDIDIFSRALSFRLEPDRQIIEGSLRSRTGDSSHWVRVTFLP